MTIVSTPFLRLVLAGLFAPAMISAMPILAETPAIAKSREHVEGSTDPSCKPAPWTLNLPAGMSQTQTQIISVSDDHIWRVAANSVPADVMLVVEYKKQVGTTGEVVLNSGAAELVEGTTVSVHVRREGGKLGAIVISGVSNMKCGKK